MGLVQHPKQSSQQSREIQDGAATKRQCPDCHPGRPDSGTHFAQLTTLPPLLHAGARGCESRQCRGGQGPRSRGLRARPPGHAAFGYWVSHPLRALRVGNPGAFFRAWSSLYDRVLKGGDEERACQGKWSHEQGTAERTTRSPLWRGHGGGGGRRRDTKGHTEGDKGKEDWLQPLFPGWTTGNFDCPAKKLRLLDAGTGEPLKMPE